MVQQAEQIKKLRELTSAGMMDCKEALTETKGNLDEAIKLLRKRGKELAVKKASRTAKEGTIGSYIHHGDKIGVLIEVNCESDFVAKNDQFKAFVKEIAMQVAAASPLYVSRDEVPSEILEQEKEIIRAQIKDKPDNVIDKIVDGRLEKYYSTSCLLEQPFIKDQGTSIKALLENIVAKFGENIIIRRFVRFAVGEEI